MTTSFKDLGIKTEVKAMVGDKIRMNRILNKEIIIKWFNIKPSKFDGDRLDLQIILEGETRVTWTSSKVLIDTIKKIAPDSFPIKTTIVNANGYYEFT